MRIPKVRTNHHRNKEEADRLQAIVDAAYVNLDPIQNNCKYGYILPDRCRYTRHLGCDCGAYPPIPFTE